MRVRGIKLTEQSTLQLSLSYLKESSTTVWDVTRFFLNEERYKTIGILIMRAIKPPTVSRTTTWTTGQRWWNRENPMT